MENKVVSLFFKGEEYTFRLKVNESKSVRNWLTVKLVPAGEKFTHAYKLIDDDHATIVWNQFANHFYSSNNNLMLNDELMDTVKQLIEGELKATG
jgi:hypothetical protein